MRKNHILKAVSLIMSICLLLSVSGVLSLYTNADTTEAATKAVNPTVYPKYPYPYETGVGGKINFVSSKNKSISDNILYKSTSGEIRMSSDGGAKETTRSLYAGLTDGNFKTNDLSDTTRFYQNDKFVNGYDPDTMTYDANNITHYTELTYDLGSEKNVDEFWISTDNGGDQGILACGTAIYETYISDTKEDLYSSENKLFTYVNDTKHPNNNTRSCFQQFVFEERKGAFFGIKIIMGVNSLKDNNYSFARIGEVALFGQDNTTVSTPKPADGAITETTSNGQTINDSIVYGKQASITYVDGTNSGDINYNKKFLNNLTDGKMKSTDAVDMGTPVFIKSYNSEDGTFTYANGYDPSNYTYNADNLETYVNITYDLETECDINEFWLFSTNNSSTTSDLAVGVYELYASNSLESLYDASSKQLVYVNKQTGEYAQKIHLDNSVSARYFGIKIINGCKKIDAANVGYSWARISQIAIFGDKKITLKGDTNGDGVVNICDLVTFSEATLPEDGIATAKRYLDMNEDGFVKQDDMSDLQKGLLGVINLNRYANLLDYSSKADGKTLINWAPENFTLKSYCDKETGGSQSIFNIINVNEGDAVYFYKDNTLYTNDELKLLVYLFNKEGLVTRQVYINNVANEPQGGISIQSGEYYMATAIATSETENAVWSVFKNNGGLATMPETAFGYKSVGPDSELYTTYNAKSYLSNYWEGNTVYNESVFFEQNSEGEVIDASLMYKPDTVFSVRSADLKTEYVEWQDYIIEGKKIKLTNNSRIKSISYDAKYPLVPESAEEQGKITNLSMMKLAEDEGRYIKNDHMREYQVYVTYSHSDTWSGAKPASQLSDLKNTKQKLENGESVNIVYYGDSITSGYNASGNSERATYNREEIETYYDQAQHLRVAPYMPAWPTLVSTALQAKYPNASINHINRAQAGTISEWGVNNVDLVTAKSPDLVVIAFGMNEPGNTMSLDKNIKSIMNAVLAVNPNAEFVLASAFIPNLNAKHFVDNKLSVQEEQLYAIKTAYADKAGVAVANVNSVNKAMLDMGKKCTDLIDDDFNHPNDFAVRIYAQTVLAALS